MLIDSHCHLDFAEFTPDREQVLADAKRAGVNNIVVPAVSQSTWQRTVKICRQHGLPFALGLHPMFIDQHEPQHLLELNDMIISEKPVAVGEMGLDYFDRAHHPAKQPAKQVAFFTKQLIIAKRCDLPALIHCRKAHDECLSILRELQFRNGIIHAFNGSIQHAEKYIELGFLLGFGGMLTYQRSRKLRELAAAISLENIALETDAPDMTVKKHRGERNSPAYLPEVAKTLAEIKKRSVIEISMTTTNNVIRCLGEGLVKKNPHQPSNSH